MALPLIFAAATVRATLIPITNSNFDLLYKPGSTSITATLSPGAWTWGVGNNVTVTGNGIAFYSDGTTGSAVDVPGWTSGDTHMGVQSPGPTFFFSSGQSDTSPNFIFCNGFLLQAPITGVPLVSDPVTVIQPDTAYTLSVRVGLRQTLIAASPVLISLAANGVALAPDASDSPTQVSGGFVTWARTYDAGSLAPFVGQSMTILLGDGAGAGGQQTDFDSVSLVSSPEPASLSFLLPISAGLLIRRSARNCERH